MATNLVLIELPASLYPLLDRAMMRYIEQAPDTSTKVKRADFVGRLLS